MLRKSNYRDLDKWKTRCREQKRRYYSKTQYARNGNVKWTEEENNLVLQHNITDTELSKLIGRSVASIQTQRSVLKKKMAQKKRT